MTVGIVAQCFREKCLVGVVDSMLSMPDMSADRLAIKNFSIGHSWLCMFSANDLSPVNAIHNAVRSEIHGDIDLDGIVAVFQSAFRKELVKKAENSVLAPFSMNMTDFRQNGLANFGPEIFSRSFYQIEQLSLEATFLVYGFDAKEEPHIFTIQNKGEVSYFDQPGFWAIGTGQTSALGSLFGISGSPINYHSSENILYLLCKAKFAAESAPGVGHNTHAIIIKSDKSRLVIFNEQIEELRTFWKSIKPPVVPVEGSAIAKRIIKEAKKEAKKKMGRIRKSKEAVKPSNVEKSEAEKEGGERI